MNGAAGQASQGVNDVNPGASTDLTGQISLILNAVYVVIGIVAVIMIIIGGVNYATSQGDPTKIKKAKDTILYGIVGLVIVLMAFAITAFVLGALNG
jgi:TRAP-type C4-dicarboxylate transport system permease small subunit